MNFGDIKAFIREIILNVARSIEVFLFFTESFMDTLTQKKNGIVFYRNYAIFLQLPCLMANI